MKTVADTGNAAAERRAVFDESMIDSRTKERIRSRVIDEAGKECYLYIQESR
jgi:hypothetical protein